MSNYRLTDNAACRIIDRFVKEIGQGRTLLEASDALLNSPDEWARVMTKRLLLCQRVRAKVVEVINNNTAPKKRCYPVATNKVWGLVTGKDAVHYYQSRNAGVHGAYDIETVWVAVCLEWGIPFPKLKQKSQGGGSSDGEDGLNVIIDGVSHIDNNPHYARSTPYVTCEKQAFTSQLMNRLRQMVSVHQKRKYKRELDDGYIDQDRLVDVARGTNLDTVREIPHRGQRVNAAVQMHVDCSGSMGGAGDAQEVACALALALGKSFQRLRVPLSVVAFDSTPLMVKDWDDKVEDTKTSRLEGGGSTNLPLSMEQCLPHLMKRKEARKVQVVLTDGSISSSNRWWKVIDEYRMKKGYECYGFGIHCDIPKGYFDGEVVGLNSGNMISAISREVGNILIHKP